MNIRKLSKKHTNSVYKLGKKAFNDEYWITKKFIEETISEPGYHYGVFVEKHLIGAIMVKKYDRPKLWIFFFIVDENHRRKGIGTKLLKKVETRCSKNYPMLFVDVGGGDFIAKKFYSKHKFRRVGSVKDWFGLGMTGIIYSKHVFKK